jgi:hypothetical protein
MGKMTCLLNPEIHHFARNDLEPWMRATERAAAFVIESLPTHLLVTPPVTPEIDGHVAWAIDLFYRLDQRSLDIRSDQNGNLG